MFVPQGPQARAREIMSEAPEADNVSISQIAIRSVLGKCNKMRRMITLSRLLHLPRSASVAPF
ncbi:hypothetical protein D3C71_1836510 [compost metagenome]